MQKATVASLLAIALFIAIAPSLASSADWQTVDTWNNTAGGETWHDVDYWGDNLRIKYWQTADSWGNIAEAVYIVGAPTLISPENNENIYDTTPTFYWVAGAHANSHQFLLDNDSDFSSPLENVSLGASATTYTIIIPLTADNENYYWKVIASSIWMENSSEVRTFELRIGAVVELDAIEDVYCYSAPPYARNTSQLKFDISPIPAGYSILSARLYLYRYQDYDWSGTANVMRVDNQTWDESMENSEFDAQSVTDVESFSNKWMEDGWDWVDVTDQLSVDYEANENTTVRLSRISATWVTGWVIDDATLRLGWYEMDVNDDVVFWRSSEATSNQPYIEVIYSEIPFKQWITADNWSNQVVIEYKYPGSGTVDDPYIIENIWALQGITNLTAHYALDNEIDATITQTWNDNGDGGYFGFDPIGTIASKFTGSFDGRGHTVDNLYINRPSSYHAGLFGYVGSGGVIENVGLDNENVRGGYTVGGFIGRNAGTISNCYTTGIVYGIGTSADYVGGLVGYNDGTVYRCYSTCTVSGDLGIGGLVGRNGTEATISNCYSVGPVSGANNVGGLVGLGQTFGYETAGASKQNVYDNICGSYYQAPENGIVNSITAYVEPGGPAEYRFAIYSKDDYSLVGYTKESGSLEAGVQWLTLNIEWGGTIVKDLDYALVAWSDGAIMELFYDFSAAWIGGYVENTDYPTFPNFWNPTTQQRKYSIYCSYTTSINVSNSFWDNVTSGQSTSAGGTGKTTENMKDNRTFTDVAWSVGLDAPWDFIGNPYDDVGDVDVWDIDEAINNGYPYLTVFVPRWQDADVWANALVTEEPPEPPPEPPADEFVWIMFIFRFLGLVGPLGIAAWKFSNIDSPTTGAEAAAWVFICFVAIVAIWFIADAVEVILYAF